MGLILRIALKTSSDFDASMYILYPYVALYGCETCSPILFTRSEPKLQQLIKTRTQELSSDNIYVIYLQTRKPQKIGKLFVDFESVLLSQEAKVKQRLIFEGGNIRYDRLSSLGVSVFD